MLNHSSESEEYAHVRERLMTEVKLHIAFLDPGKPALNLCDRAAMVSIKDEYI